MKYNHMFDVAFTVDSDKENPDEVTFEELIEGLLNRLPQLYHDGLDSFGHCDSCVSELGIHIKEI